MLAHAADRYGGVIIDSKQLPEDPSLFEKELVESLDQWRSSGVRGIWIKIPTPLGALVPACTKNGFDFHHAKPGYVCMTAWLPGGSSSLPLYSFTQIGVGGIVFNSEGQLLAVQEKVSPLAKFQGFWKLPGGLADPGEHIGEVAAREVFEETGVRARPVGVVCFRHHHGVAHGQGDIYFVVKCVAETTEINMCEKEIGAAAWMDVDEYINSDKVLETNKNIARLARSGTPGAAVDSTDGLVAFQEIPDVRGAGHAPSRLYYANEAAPRL